MKCYNSGLVKFVSLSMLVAMAVAVTIILLSSCAAEARYGDPAITTGAFSRSCHADLYRGIPVLLHGSDAIYSYPDPCAPPPERVVAWETTSIAERQIDIARVKLAQQMLTTTEANIAFFNAVLGEWLIAIGVISIVFALNMRSYYRNLDNDLT